MKFFLLFLLLMPAICVANTTYPPFEVGYGVMRENHSLNDYHVLILGWRFQPHWAAVGGTLMGGPKNNWVVDGHDVSGPDLADNFVGVQFQEWEQYLMGGIGLVRLSRQTLDLTSRWQYYLTFGVHFGGWSLSYRHLSDGHFLIGSGSNYGEDLLVFGYNF